MTQVRQTDSRARVRMLAGVLVAGALALLVLTWAKWLPYGTRTAGLAADHTWPGSSILDVGGVRSGDAPSWSAATSFTWAYVQAVWKALVAALLIGAALQTLVPRTWLLRVLNRRGRLSSAAAGGLAGMPSMMCTCCTAPVAVSLKRQGASTAAVVAYWLGNPLLNPAVLVPEYLVVVMVIGGFRGWLFPLTTGGGLVVVLLAALVGTVLVIPTAGEIPIVQGLALAGLSLGGVGALLVTLPAVSLPGAIMVGRAFGWRVTAATAGVVAAGGLLAASLLSVLPA
jgi:uncharacterized membrane protein YraQ (UPF0718 family)